MLERPVRPQERTHLPWAVAAAVFALAFLVTLVFTTTGDASGGQSTAGPGTVLLWLTGIAALVSAAGALLSGIAALIVARRTQPPRRAGRRRRRRT